MKRNDKPSARVARIARRILAAELIVVNICPRLESGAVMQRVSEEDIRALAASYLAQAPDRFQPLPPKAHERIEWSDTSPQFDGVTGKKRRRIPKAKTIARKIALRHKRDSKGYSA